MDGVGGFQSNESLPTPKFTVGAGAGRLPAAPAPLVIGLRRQLGQQHGAIALAWEVAPPAGDLATAPIQISAGEFTFSEHEKERYRAMGFAFGSEVPEEEQPTP